MVNRYEALLYVWSGKDGCWHPRSLGTFKRAERAARRLYAVRRYYTRYERHDDFGEILDLKTSFVTECRINASYNVPTVGDLGWTP